MSGRHLLLLLLLTSGPALAQEEVVAPPPEQPAPAETPARPAHPPPPPILVTVIPTGRIAADIVAAAEGALVTQLTAMSGGRPVHALNAPELQAAINACHDGPCLGALLAQANAQAGAILRLSIRRNRLAASLQLLDPVSGADRLPALNGELPRDAATIGAAVTELSAQLQGAMPSPPPPPATLLVTVSVDGASVRIDDHEVGASPVAAEEVEPGPHDVTVGRAGYGLTRRHVEVRPGEQARLDVTLERMSAGAAQTSEPGWMTPDVAPRSPELYEEWWFWTIVGGSALVIALIAIGAAVASSGGPVHPSGIQLPPIGAM